MLKSNYIRCKRCNRLLKSQTAQQLGYGKKCYELHNEQTKIKHKSLFEHKV